MDEIIELPDSQYLYKLRLDYLQAVQQGDYRLIDAVIVPQFWERFGKYYDDFSKTWKEVTLSRLPVQVVIDPTQERRFELDWAESVLKGHIEIIM
jgi:hypothetical protein